jgi:hypothetical protein
MQKEPKLEKNLLMVKKTHTHSNASQFVMIFLRDQLSCRQDSLYRDTLTLIQDLPRVSFSSSVK